MNRETNLRKLVQAIERQIALGFNEQGDPLDLKAAGVLLREARMRLAAEELHEPGYKGAIH